MTTNTIYRHFCLAMLCMGCVAVSNAQSVAPKVSAKVSPDSIMIGDRFTIEIVVDKDQVQNVAFPVFDNEQKNAEASSSVECIADMPVDTVSRAGRRVVLRKRYEMAAFDEGIYHMGRAQVLYADKNIVDTLYSDEEMSLVVNTFQIDSTSHAPFDLKPQKHLPFRFGEISGYLCLALLILAIVAAIVYGIVKWMHKHGRRVRDIFKPAPPLPPHVVAITALEELHNRKLWQNGEHKLYYSGLSDILRTYIAGRYGIGAMEMTTDEIVEAMRPIDIPDKCSMGLVAVLRDADLVKFAKAVPEAAENEESYNRSYYFVEETKPIEVVEEGVEADVLKPTKDEIE